MTRYARYLFAILLIITSFSTAGAVAQAAEPDPASSTFVTQLEGLTIDLGNSGEARFDPIEYYPPERYRGPAGTYTQEHIMFRVGNSDVFVTVMLGDTTPESWNQESVNGLSSGGNSHQILGRYADEEFGWLFTLDQNRMDILTASYYEIYASVFGDADIAVSIYGDPADLLDTIAWVQLNLTIEDVSFYTNTDTDEIEAMLNGTSANAPIPVRMNRTSVADWASSGLISDSEWIHPTLDATVTWNPDTLEFPFHTSDAIIFDEGNVGVLTLYQPDFSGEYFINIGDNVDNRTMQDWAERWASEEWLIDTDKLYPAVDYRFDEERASAIYTSETIYNYVLVVTIRESYFLPDGSVVIITAVATPDRIVDHYLEATDAILINGEPVTPSYSEAELRELFPGRGLTASSNNTNQSTDQDWSRYGLVSDTEWQSPHSNTSFSWGADLWFFPSHEDDAIKLHEQGTSLKLYTNDERGWVTLQTHESQHAPARWIESILLDDGRNGFTVIDSFITDETASVIGRYDRDGGTFIAIFDFYLNDDGVTIMTSVFAPPDQIASVYADVWDGIQSNGDFYPLTWTLEDIESLSTE